MITISTPAPVPLADPLDLLMAKILLLLAGLGIYRSSCRSLIYKGCGMKNKEGEVPHHSLIFYARMLAKTKVCAKILLSGSYFDFESFTPLPPY